ncbi:MAG: hypothetical protein AB7R87_26390 [Parvibaculaceae bacterium]
MLSFIAFSIRGSCQVFLDYCPLVLLSIVQDVPDMQADILFGGLEQFRQLRLREPDAAVPGVKLDNGCAVLGLMISPLMDGSAP